MDNCIFCKIINKEIPSQIVYEDDKVLAFNDVNPMAPVHVLCVPKKHIASANKLGCEDAELVGHIVVVLAKIAKELGIAEDGYRIVNNCGENAGQTVHHLHFHLLGGAQLENKLA